MRVYPRIDFTIYFKGVHKDDLIFTLDGNKIKNFGSQGQQKSF